MNKEYIKELFDEYQQDIIDSGYDMETPEDLENLIKDIVISNLQFDFHMYPDVDKLFTNKTESKLENKMYMRFSTEEKAEQFMGKSKDDVELEKD